MLSTTMTITEGRRKIFQVAQTIARRSSHVILTENGKPTIVMMSAEEFEAWQETMGVLGDTSLLKDVRKALKEAKEGKLVSLEDVLKKEGISYSVKVSKHVSRCSDKKR